MLIYIDNPTYLRVYRANDGPIGPKRIAEILDEGVGVTDRTVVAEPDEFEFGHAQACLRDAGADLVEADAALERRDALADGETDAGESARRRGGEDLRERAIPEANGAHRQVSGLSCGAVVHDGNGRAPVRASRRTTAIQWHFGG